MDAATIDRALDSITNDLERAADNLHAIRKLLTADLAAVTELADSGWPKGCALKTELVDAEQLILGDRVVEASRQVVGPEKDALAHFRPVVAVGGSVRGRVWLAWGDSETTVPRDWPFVRITSGRSVVTDEDGDRAQYSYEGGA